MKKLLLCFILASVGLTLSAQKNDTKKTEIIAKDQLKLIKPNVDVAKVKAATEKMVKLYGLTPAQIPQMKVILERKFQNLAEVAKLKGNDRMAYLTKLKSTRLGMEGSLKRLLTPRQMLTFDKLQKERKIKESEIIKELKAKGISRNEIRLAVIERMEEVD